MAAERRFNLDALRNPRRLSGLLDPLLSSVYRWRLSRREFLILGGAGLTASGLQNHRPFSVRRDGERVSFLLDGHEVWRIDPGLFSGEPRLEVTDQRHRVVVHLQDAFFPGTRVPASFRCVVTDDVPGWQMAMEMDCGMQFSAVFVRWLSGEGFARGEWSPGVLTIAGPVAVRFDGPVLAQFTPDWRFGFRGEMAVGLDEAAEPLKSNSALLTPAETEQLAASVLGRHTTATFHRGAAAWKVQVAHQPEAPWRLSAYSDIFDVLVVEAAEGPSTPQYTALLGQSPANPARMRFHISEHLKDSDNESVALPLKSVHLIRTLAETEQRSVLVAEVEPSGEWLRAQDFSLVLDHGGEALPFELVQRNDRVESLKVSTRISQASLPASVDSCATITFSNALPIDLTWDGASEPSLGSGLQVAESGTKLAVDLCQSTLSVLRPSDLLRLDFRFENLKLSTFLGARLERCDPNKPARITVVFPPQNVAEEAFYLVNPVLADPNPQPVAAISSTPVRARIAEPSELVFELPEKLNHIPFQLADLLHWEKWNPRVHPVAMTADEGVQVLTTSGSSTPDLPTSRPDGFTFLELPYRLMLSPHAKSAWAHAPGPVDHKTRFIELWHTRLAGRNSAGNIDEHDEASRTVRAIWSPDLRMPNDADWPHDHADTRPFTTSLDVQDRNEIVHLTSNFKITQRASCINNDQRPYIPSPVHVEQLMLSSMGGWLRSHGMWEPPHITLNKALTVEQWHQIATTGRDHYVRVVYKGYLLPFGHRASLIKVTERRFDLNKDNILGAFLRQRMYIVLRQRVKEFPGFGQWYDGRRFPWRKVEAVTLVTPDLEKPNPSQSYFWPIVAGQPFPFRFRFWDLDGNVSESSAGVVFADNQVAGSSDDVTKARDLYNNAPDDWKTWHFGGKKIAYAPSKKPGDTQYDTDAMRFEAEAPNAPSDPVAQKDFYSCLLVHDQPFFYPKVNQASLKPAAVQRITGKSDPVFVQYEDNYAQHGFDPAKNRGEVFFQITDSRLDLGFGGSGKGDQAGGIITPNLRVVGFSRQQGPVGGGGRSEPSRNSGASSSLAKLAAGEFDAVDFFGGALEGAKILGGISLWDIIRPLAPGLVSNLEQAPKMLEEALFPVTQDLLKIEQDVVALLDRLPNVAKNKFSSELQEVRSSLAKVTANQSDLRLHAQLVRSILQLVDRIRAVVENPTQLLETAFQDLIQPLTDFQGGLVASVTASLNDWKTTYTNEIVGLQNDLQALLQMQQQQVQVYASQIDQVTKTFQADLALITGIVSDPSKLLNTLGPLLAAQVPSLSSLEDIRKRLATLIGLAKIQNYGQLLGQIRQILSVVQNLNIVAAEAEQQVQTFEGQCLLWIATLPEVATTNQPLARQAAQQLVRQAAGAMRDVVSKMASGSALANLLKTERQVLTSLQQLQLSIVTPTKLPPAAVVNLPPVAQQLVDMCSDLAGSFTAVSKALSPGNLEDALKAIAQLLPAEIQSELKTLIAVISATRSTIQNASGQTKQILVTYQLQLFDLWLKYQDPFTLAAAVFGLSPSQLTQIANLQRRYDALKRLASSVQHGLTSLQRSYQTFLQSLPSLAQTILSAWTKRATDSIATAVGTTADELIFAAEQQAIAAISDLYSELLRRLRDPLNEVQDLLNLKNDFDELLKSLPLPDSVTIAYDWNPEIKSFEPVFQVKDTSKLTINAKFTAYFSGAAPSWAVDGKLTDFEINLIGSPQFITVRFSSLTFSSHSGSKPDCHAVVSGVELKDSLSFVSKLQELLSPKDGPYLELADGLIKTGFRFGVPAITAGAFNLQQLRLQVGVGLAFNGDPARCEFAISSRDHPFLLSVGIFGGGGFLRMLLGLDGVELLEGALEFGVVAEISIGVASGGGYVVAGIYFRVEKSLSVVCGFVHANGHLDVLGLISMDLDAYVQVCYRNGNVEGEATLTVHIEILFFSEDVTLHAHYQFAGSGGHSTARLFEEAPRGYGDGTVPPSLQTKRAPSRGLGKIPCMNPPLADPPKPGDYCDLGSADEWSKYRKAFAW